MDIFTITRRLACVLLMPWGSWLRTNNSQPYVNCRKCVWWGRRKVPIKSVEKDKKIHLGLKRNFQNENYFSIIFIVILLQLPQFSPFALLCPPPPHFHCHFQQCSPCPWLIHTCSLSSPSPFFPPLFPSPLPSGHFQAVPCFQA